MFVTFKDELSNIVLGIITALDEDESIEEPVEEMPKPKPKDIEIEQEIV